MGITHKKRLFAKHFARTKDRRGSIEAAGYSLTDWSRQASRLLADADVLHLLDVEADKELRRERAGKMTVADVISELEAMLRAADDKPGRSDWSAKLIDPRKVPSEARGAGRSRSDRGTARGEREITRPDCRA